MKKKLVSIALATCGAATLLAGCDGNKVKINGLNTKYFAEYGEMFVMPSPEIVGSDEECSWQVFTQSGDEVFDALFGSFYPEIGDYTMTCSVGGVSQTVTLECRDTVGPVVSYFNYTPVVFEGDDISIPTFSATDMSGVENDSEFKIYKGNDRTTTITVGATDTTITAESGVSEYHFVYSVSDKIGNKTEKDLVTEVRQLFTDQDIDENTLFDFDEDDYVNLVSGSNVDLTAMPEIAISDAVTDSGKALKLSFNEGNKYYGVNLVRGNTLNTGVVFTFELNVYPTTEIVDFTIESKKDTLAPISFANLKANEWNKLKFSSRQLSPDYIDIEDLDIRFMGREGGSLYIDYVKGITLSVDTTLAKNLIADFDEDLYLNNIEQAGYDIGNGQITAEYEIVQKNDMPEAAIEGTTGGALHVSVKDVWVTDYAGYGVLGDGVKYNFNESFNTEELKEGGILGVRFFCETGNAMALSFNYKHPISGDIKRSKARWVRGVEGEWVDLKLDYQLITQIVPYTPISKPGGGVFEDFEITSVVITTCGNVPIDEADIQKGFRTPCTSFYIDSIKLVKGNFIDNNREAGILADFDEDDYADFISQAWTYVAVTADIDFRPEGSQNLPEGTKGGAIYCKANYIDDVVYPNQGARGDGVRYTLPEPIMASDLNEVSLRVYAVTGTACYVGYVVNDKDGNRVQRQGFWENCANGEGNWSTITQDKSRLSIRLQPTDQVVAILIYARGDGLNGLTSLSEFYLDEIGYKIANTYSWKGTTVSGNTEGWNGSTKGGATINVLEYADRESKNLLGQFPYSGSGSIKVPNFLAGFGESDQVLEVLSRCSTSTSYCDGAKVTFGNALSFTGNSKIKITMYSTTVGHSGYSFYVKDSSGHMYDWRIQTSMYTAYSWTTFELNISTLTGAGLTDIKSIDLVAVGTTLDTGLTCTYAAYKGISLEK